MSVEIIRQRIDALGSVSAQEQHHRVREILQEIALSGLARADFFRQAAFHGGTCLRVLHHMRRFSEDLDFILKSPDPDFRWSPYEDGLAAEFRVFGIDLEIRQRPAPGAIASVWLKDQSLGRLLNLQHPLRSGQKIIVKLEVDTRPPLGSSFQIAYLDFPVPFSVLALDLRSGFANKIHALLCRKYVKGRDWFDFTWYLAQQIHPTLALLENAIAQQGPWAGQRIPFDDDWLLEKMQERIESIDWQEARRDVERFLGEPELSGLTVWGVEFFMAQHAKLAGLLAGAS